LKIEKNSHAKFRGDFYKFWVIFVFFGRKIVVGGNLEFFEGIFVIFLGYFLYFKGKKFKKISSNNKNLATLFLHEKVLKKKQKSAQKLKISPSVFALQNIQKY
jgi:hypothetical protein